MINKIKQTLLGEGISSPELRQNIYTKVEGNVLHDKPISLSSNELNAYINKLTMSAHRLTDKDFGDLKTAGFSEDEIFELTVTAATSAGFSRLAKGMELLKKT